MSDQVHDNQPFRVFMGWDQREDIAYQVARHSLMRHATVPVEVEPIKIEEMRTRNLYWRSEDPLASTEFTYTRFLTPLLAGYTGWALFCDCDFLFLGDIAEITAYRDPRMAVYCVQHDYHPSAETKMDGKIQTNYPRKNWSSFLLFNCSHPSTRRLDAATVNGQTGAFLHRLQWASDDEIGALPEEWNWLEGWSAKPASGTPKAVHYTSGGPWFDNWRDVAYVDLWDAEKRMLP